MFLNNFKIDLSLISEIQIISHRLAPPESIKRHIRRFQITKQRLENLIFYIDISKRNNKLVSII